MAGLIAGQTVEYFVQGSTGEWMPRTPDDVRSKAISVLSQFGVTNSLTITKQSGRLPLDTIDLWDWRYEASGTLVLKYGHRSLEDVRAIIQSAFWQAAGEQVTVTFPDFGEIQGSGVQDETPSKENKYLGVAALTIIAAVGVAVFVLKRG